MAWAKSTTTKHTCGGPVFGKKTPGCPRCDELLDGAAPVVWNTRPKWDYAGESRRHHAHCDICTGRTRGVCTFGEW